MFCNFWKIFVRVMYRSTPFISFTFTGIVIYGVEIAYSSEIVRLVRVVRSMLRGEIII